jgi:hypothetical protein
MRSVVADEKVGLLLFDEPSVSIFNAETSVVI